MYFVKLPNLEYLNSSFCASTLPDEQIVTYIERLIDLDSKLGGLKTLEGLIWQEGYESGELKSEVYDDVPESLIRWKKSGKKVYIYSSGSVLAQKLLFKYSKFGNLTKYIDGYFDTEIGPKKDVKRYVNISNKLGVFVPVHCLMNICKPFFLTFSIQ